MRFIDLLILILQAHAQSLSRMAGAFGDETLAEILDAAAEKLEESPEVSAALFGELEGEIKKIATLAPAAETTARGSGRRHAQAEYAEIEGAVKDFHLGGLMEFHLWCYPIYRAFAESSIPLTWYFDRHDAMSLSQVTALIDTVVQTNERWLRFLSQSEHVGNQLVKLTQPAWNKFRASALKLAGQRPFLSLPPSP